MAKKKKAPKLNLASLAPTAPIAMKGVKAGFAGFGKKAPMKPTAFKF